MMIDRTIYPLIKETIMNRPVTLITGARQVGKTYLCRMLMKELRFNYVSLQNPIDRAEAKRDPSLFLKVHKDPLIIDEIQYVPELFEYLQTNVEVKKMNDENYYGMYVITGSQSYRLMEGVTQSMAGRIGIINMAPLSQSEINKVEELPFVPNLDNAISRIQDYQIGYEDLYQRICRGFYPELYDKKSLKSDLFYASYVQTYLEQDVAQIVNIKDMTKFTQFITLLASMTGEELIYSALANNLGVKIDTVQSWVSVLVATGIVRLIQPYSENSLFKRVIKRPKIYFCDTGLACYLTKLSNPKTLINSRFNGQFVETYIVNEIIKSYQNNGIEPAIYYYRDVDQREIDLILIENGKIHCVECKNGVSYSLSDVRNFNIIKSSTKYEFGTSCIICNTDSIYSLDENIYVFPISVI